MRLMINGVEKMLDAATVCDVLEALEIQQPYVAVALNGACVRKSDFASTPVRERDEIEILVPMQGG